MKIRPLHDWAVIKRIEPEEKTAGGIIIPVVAREKPADGIVEAIGPGKYGPKGKGKKEKFVPTTVRPGQRVVFTDFMARDVEVAGRKITLVREEDILGTYEGGGHLVRKESHPVSVRKERPLLIPEKTSGKSAVLEQPKSGAAAGPKASGKKKATGKKTLKKAVRPPVRKKIKSGEGAVKKKEKTGKAKTAAGKALKKAVKKTAGKTAVGKAKKTAPRAAVARKTAGKKKAVSTKPVAGKKAVSRKKAKPGKR